MTAHDFRQWRHRLGWTQSEAARQVGRTRQMVIHYEAGTYQPELSVRLAMNALEHLPWCRKS